MCDTGKDTKQKKKGCIHTLLVSAPWLQLAGFERGVVIPSDACQYLIIGGWESTAIDRYSSFLLSHADLIPGLSIGCDSQNASDAW